MTDETQSVLDPEEVDIELCGRTYRWKMPPARECRECGSELARIELMVTRDPTAFLSAMNCMLDFFYAHNKGMAKDQAVLDAAQGRDILAAFKEVQRFFAPFLRNQTDGITELVEEIQAQQSETDKKSPPSNS